MKQIAQNDPELQLVKIEKKPELTLSDKINIISDKIDLVIERRKWKKASSH